MRYREEPDGELFDMQKGRFVHPDDFIQEIQDLSNEVISLEGEIQKYQDHSVDSAKEIDDLQKEIDAVEELKSPQWTKTSDSLPEGEAAHVDCWVIRNGCVENLPFNTHFKCWDDRDYDDYWCDALEVSHWMKQEIPSPPKED